MSDTDGVSLAEALAGLRDELRDARLQADESLPLTVKLVEVELSVELTTQYQGKAGVSAWKVLSAESSGSRAASRVHRVSLTIEPGVLNSEGERAELDVATAPISDAY